MMDTKSKKGLCKTCYFGKGPPQGNKMTENTVYDTDITFSIPDDDEADSLLERIKQQLNKANKTRSKNKRKVMQGLKEIGAHLALIESCFDYYGVIIPDKPYDVLQKRYDTSEQRYELELKCGYLEMNNPNSKTPLPKMADLVKIIEEYDTVLKQYIRLYNEHIKSVADTKQLPLAV